MGILAKVFLIGFTAFWALGILLYVIGPGLWHFIRQRLTSQDRPKSKPPDRPAGEPPGTGEGHPNNERR